MPARKKTPYGKVYRQLVEYEDKITQLELWRMNLVPPSVGIFDEPKRCYELNNEWAKIVMGMVSWLAETPVWRDAENEGYSAIEKILEFMIGQPCMTFELRQNPDNPCLLEQSLDGGVIWTTAYDYSLCSPAFDVNEEFQNALDALQALLDAYDGSVLSIAPNMVYDATATDDIRDVALCHALRELVDLMCEVELQWRDQISFYANLTAAILGLAGIAVSILTAGTGTPLALAVGSAFGGAFGVLFDGLSEAILTDGVARDAVACCMFDALKNSTITKNDLELSLSGCGFGGGSNESQLAGAIDQMLLQDNIYESFVDYLERAYRLAELGIASCNCDLSWTHTFDFTTGQLGWSFAANRGSYIAGVGFRALKYSNNETAIYIYNDNLPVNTITEVTINGTFTGDTTVSYRAFTALYYDAVQNLASYGSYTPPNAPTQLQLIAEQQNYGLRFHLYLTGFVPAPAPIMTWQTMTIKGTGVNPFI